MHNEKQKYNNKKNYDDDDGSPYCDSEYSDISNEDKYQLSKER